MRVPFQSEAPPVRLLYPLAEACALLGGVSRSKLYELIRAGVIRPVHVGRSAKIPAAELQAFVDRLVGEVSAPEESA